MNEEQKEESPGSRSKRSRDEHGRFKGKQPGGDNVENEDGDRSPYVGTKRVTLDNGVDSLVKMAIRDCVESHADNNEVVETLKDMYTKQQFDMLSIYIKGLNASKSSRRSPSKEDAYQRHSTSRQQQQQQLEQQRHRQQQQHQHHQQHQHQQQEQQQRQQQQERRQQQHSRARIEAFRREWEDMFPNSGTSSSNIPDVSSGNGNQEGNTSESNVSYIKSIDPVSLRVVTKASGGMNLEELSAPERTRLQLGDFIDSIVNVYGKDPNNFQYMMETERCTASSMKDSQSSSSFFPFTAQPSSSFSSSSSSSSSMPRANFGYPSSMQARRF